RYAFLSHYGKEGIGPLCITFEACPATVVWKSEEGFPAEIYCPPSDRGPKLRSPSQNSPRVVSKRDVNITKLLVLYRLFLTEDMLFFPIKSTYIYTNPDRSHVSSRDGGVVLNSDESFTPERICRSGSSKGKTGSDSDEK
ncbi:hypothetical protein AVEN_193633-2-1, partial [Araneus ventricosus]